MEALYVQMLGDFVISTRSVQISDRDNRSRKLWVLLAYLIYHRRRTVTREELVRLLWNEEEKGKNPAGALKTAFHRIRSMLDMLWPKAGRELILYKNGGYMWNPGVSISVDIDEFDRLCSVISSGKDPDRQEFEVLQSYKGDFLAKMSSEVWVIPIAAYYHNSYLRCLLKLLPQLLEQEKCSEAAGLCRAAAMVEPYDEEIHGYLMRALLGMGDQKGAAKIYEQFSERLNSDFGIVPGEEIRMLYYEAKRTDNGHAIPVEIILQQLREEDEKGGALICEYDFFRVLYRSMARFMSRSGVVAHIALLSVEENQEGKLTQRKLRGAMHMLEEQIRICLRRGDATAKCSNSQYIVMLPLANYENSCMVCERVIQAYYRKHPHSDADIRYVVYPLHPDSQSVCAE